ncbi:C1 family peptidase [Actinacidiphila sp. DG2A-62]|uniref:C1 family peptidase n=1 Tax=Actinacidiphila sp. DG2A-62 TaxID=3108821 RepID=UPI002DB7C5CE|nr:C1 family peptidase [Actinacidiphila sp. DG2A-62]MEC3994006.1 C1 family peptidase [Actinacidiphila sp. DG2A-62]
MTMFQLIPENPDAPYRTGRHQVHDWLLPEREASVRRGTPILTVTHAELQDPFDQGQVGSCTMNAAYGALVTVPFAKPQQAAIAQSTIQDGYRLETRIDDSQIPGHWEPDDTGSAGPWSMIALEKLGLISSWHHTRSLTTALRLLNSGPISIGVTWYNSMFTLDAKGQLVISEADGIGGGHQVCVTADDAEARRVLIRNSWGTGWGDRGHAWLSWSDLDDLLQDGGDVVQPVMS